MGGGRWVMASGVGVESGSEVIIIQKKLVNIYEI